MSSYFPNILLNGASVSCSVDRSSCDSGLLFDEIFCRQGVPCTLLSEGGSNFLSSLVREFCHLLNTRKVNTTAYHPQTDGLVKRFNNTLAEAILYFVSCNQQDWDVYTSPCSSTGDTNFYLLYGRELRLPPDVSLSPSSLDSLMASTSKGELIKI